MAYGGGWGLCVLTGCWQHLGHVHHVLVSEIPVTQLWKHHLMHLPAARLRFSCVPHAEACHDTHTSQINLRTHAWFLEYLRCGISERLVGDYVNYVNLCAVVVLYCYDGTEVFEKNWRWLWMHVGCPRGQVYCSEFAFSAAWMVHSWRFSYSFRDQLCVKCFFL